MTSCFRSVNTPQTRIVTLIVRYGLPAIILAFYLTAARRFAYTPDSTYSGAIAARTVAEEGAFSAGPDQSPRFSSNPLWVLFQAAGIRASIEPLLFSKVFSLFFCCMGLVLAYLVANEILDDRLLAFCATFVLAMQTWLLFLAPGGSAIPAASTLALACIFFLLRNEYVLASFFAGIVSLLLWEGVILFGLVMTDLVINSVRQDKVIRIASVSFLVYAVVVVPWVIYGVRQGVPLLTALARLDEMPGSGILTLASNVLLVVLAAGGIALSVKGSEWKKDLLQHVVPLLWAAILLAWALLGRWELLPIGMPPLVILAFRGLQRMAVSLRKEATLYPLAFGVVALSLLFSQIEFNIRVKPDMISAEASAFERDAVAAWVKSNVGDSLSLAADFPGQLAYRTGKTVIAWSPGGHQDADAVVCSSDTLPGYAPAYALQLEDIAQAGGKSITVWKKRI